MHDILEHFDTECPVFEINYNGENQRICNNKFSDEISY